MNRYSIFMRNAVLFGLVFMYLSYGVYKLYDVRELYPFFYWRLYSEPIGIEEEGTVTFRLYSDSGDGVWRRHPHEANPHYTRQEYVEQWNYLVGSAILDQEGPARERLARFVTYYVPAAERYRVVAETFRPLDLLQNPSSYDTTTVLVLEPIPEPTRRN